MNKTVSITISGALFHIEEHAYKKLEAYLASIRAHFQTFEDNLEIVTDIEARIAEHFSSLLSKSKKVITEKDIDQLIDTMGTVEDFEAFEHTGDDSPRTEKRLFRNPNDRMIAGVASGLAAYFGWETVWVRVLFALSILLGGYGILLYIILWIIMPEAKSPIDQVAMRGDPLNLKSIESKIRTAIPKTTKGAEKGFKKILMLPFRLIRMIFELIGRIVRFLFPIAGRIFGVLLIIGSSIALFFLTFLLFVLLSDGAAAYFDVPVHEFVGVFNFKVLVVSGYFFVAIPLLLITIIGTSFTRLTNMFTFRATSVLIGLWIISTMTGAVTAFTVAPSFAAAMQRYEQQHWVQIEQTFNVRDFSRIDVSDSFELNILQGAFNVSVSASKEEMKELVLSVEDGTLKVDRKMQKEKICFFCNRHRIRLDVTMPALAAARYGGASYGTIERFHDQDLSLELRGAAQITFDGSIRTLNADVSDASYLSLTGSALKLNAELSGASHVDAFSMQVREAIVDLSGASHANLNIQKSLSGQASGASSVEYVSASGATISLQTSGASWVDESRSEYDDFTDEFEDW